MASSRPKKSYGQHFLTNTHTAQRIAHACRCSTGRMLEVGPGKGMLTQYLLERKLDFKAVEADRDMVDYLGENFPQLNGRVLAGDFLKLRMEDIFDAQPFSLVGNFPYNISSQILIKMLGNYSLIPEMVGMFQKEVASRVVAGEGSKTYGVISVLVQAWYKPEYLFGVNKGQFNPPPKVQSAVIRLTRRKHVLVPDELERTFRIVVKQTFNQRRKMLRNTLKSIIKDPELLKKEQFRKRPEQLSVTEFVELARIVDAQLES